MANSLSSLLVRLKIRREIHVAGDPLRFNRKDQILFWIPTANNPFGWCSHSLLNYKLGLMWQWWRPRKFTSWILLVYWNKHAASFPASKHDQQPSWDMSPQQKAGEGSAGCRKDGSTSPALQPAPAICRPRSQSPALREQSAELIK